MLSNEKFLINAIKWLCFVALFTPLIISSSTLFPYVFGKSIAFQVLVDLMLICYIWLLYLGRQRTGRFNYLPSFNLLFWTLTAFFAVFVISTILSVDSYYSFWSKQERMEGLFNMFHFLAFGLILAGALKDRKSWWQILNVCLIASFVVSLHAVGQFFGWFFTPYGNRVTATLGNAAFIATYLLFNIYFAFLLFVQTKNIWFKSWYAFLMVLEFVVLLLTYTRGAILGLLIGLIGLLLGYIFFLPERSFAPGKLSNNKLAQGYYSLGAWLSQKNRKKKIAAALIFLLIASWTTAYVLRDTSFVKGNPLLQRLTEISFEAGTGKIRIISWKIGLSAFLEKPLFGWGQSNYYVAFNKYMDPTFFTYSGETFDRAHNKYIDLLVMHGLLGLIAYLAIFIAILLILFPKRNRLGIVSLILIALAGSYAIQNFILFDMPMSYLMFFLFLGLVFFIDQEAQGRPVKPEHVQPNKKDGFGPIPYILTLIVVFSLWTGSIKPLLASQKSIQAQQVLGASNKSDQVLQKSMDLFKESVEYGAFTNQETRKNLSAIYTSIQQDPAFSSKKKIEALTLAADQLEAGIKEMPLFIEYYLNLADIYNQLAGVDKQYLAQGESTIRNVTDRLYPNVPHPHYKLIINRLLAEDYPAAIQDAQKTVELNPQLTLSHWYLGMSYYYAGDLPQAKLSLEKAIEMGHSYASNMGSFSVLTDLYARLKEYNTALSYYQEAMQADPSNPYFKFGAAKVYKEVGEIDKAEELARQSLGNMPEQNAQEVNEFIASLN